VADDGHHRLVLASASEARRRMLVEAGLEFTVQPSDVDERSIHEALRGDDGSVAAEDVAEVLARAKAQDVSAKMADALVIGADQVLALGNRMFEKPQTDDEARSQLLELRGKTHTLHSAVALAEGGDVVWCHTDTARVTMRSFSAAFVGRYMAMAGDKVLQSVGCYQLEGPGVQLIESVSGDAFTVLGLPLFALLEELRQRGVLLV
jgi:nucleoside triphosphate pyrophosphatase